MHERLKYSSTPTSAFVDKTSFLARWFGRKRSRGNSSVGKLNFDIRRSIFIRKAVQHQSSLLRVSIVFIPRLFWSLSRWQP